MRILQLLRTTIRNPACSRAPEHSFQGFDGLDAEVIAQRTKTGAREQIAQTPATLSVQRMKPCKCRCRNRL